MKKIRSSEITPERTYFSRREFLVGAGGVAAGVLLGGCTNNAGNESQGPARSPVTGAIQDELGNPLTSLKDITSYNNFYEFTTDQQGVAAGAADFRTKPWTVSVGGLVRRKRRFGVEDLVKRFKPEERVYRLRCVEGWSMVIPWLGFPLASLLNETEPTSRARFVSFTTLLDPEQMPGQSNTGFSWPYVEGLRLDEALIDLVILSTGLYGRDLLPQNGAPLRLVVPWKYGFKSAKSIVKIELVEKIPLTFWMKSSPAEYGFFANVNPDVAHPRWSQATERPIGQTDRRQTVLFNGYGDEVSNLYTKLDLEKNF